jgi:FSR family fosmidomycin resistance protein-like MFS transporter
LARIVGIGSRGALQLGFSHFLIDSQMALLAVSMPFLIRDLALTLSEAGVVIGASVLFAAMPQPVTGQLSDRVSRKRMLVFGLIVCGVGSVLTSRSSNFLELLVFQCIVGVSSSIFHPLGYSLTSYLSDLAYRGRALGFLSGSGDLGMLAAFSSTGPLSLAFGWRAVFLVWGLLVLGFSAIFAFLGSLGDSHQRRKEGLRGRELVGRIAPELVFMVLLSLVNRIFLSFLPTYLSEAGVAESSASVFLGALVSLGILGELTGGSLTDKFGPRVAVSTLMAVLALVSLSIYLVGSGSLLPLITVVAGFPLFATYPCIYTATSQVAGESRGIAYGLLISVGWVGSAIGPPVAGALGDVYGLSVIFILVMVVSFVASGFAARFLKVR